MSDSTFSYSVGVYEITVNPNDKLQFFGRKQRLQLFVQNMIKVFTTSMKDYDINYTMVLEISMPHININRDSSIPRLHYHGIIELKTPITVTNFLLYGLYKLSRVCNVTVNDYREQEWDAYLYKMQEILKPTCKKYNIPYIIDEKTKMLIIKEPQVFKFSY